MYFEIVGSKTVDISNKKQIRTIDIYRSKSLIKPSNSGVLIQGNNLDIMISLLDEYKGKINLIYIDPPYLTGLDFKTRGGSFAYSDKFTREQYYQMMYDRLLLMKELLSDNGSIYVQVIVCLKLRLNNLPSVRFHFIIRIVRINHQIM